MKKIDVGDSLIEGQRHVIELEARDSWAGGEVRLSDQALNPILAEIRRLKSSTVSDVNGKIIIEIN